MDATSPGHEMTGDPRGLVDLARTRFAEGEIRQAADIALRAGEQAARAGDHDVVADAALVVDGVPDPRAAATVERLCRLALADGSGVASDPLRCRLEAQLSVALHHREALAESRGHLERAAELAASTDDGLAHAAAIHARILATAGSDRGPHMLALADELLAAATRTGSAIDELKARTWRIDGLLRSEGTARVRHEVDMLDVLASRTGLPLVRWNAEVARAGLDQSVGRFAAAEAHARAARSALPRSQLGQTEPLFIAQLMLISIDRGSVPPELEMVREQAIGAPHIVGAMMARYDLEMGDLPRARAAYEALRPRLDSLEIDRRTLPTLSAAAELAVAFGDAATAAMLHARLEPFDGLLIGSALGTVGPMSFFLARLEGLLGAIDAAVARAGSAVELAARGGFGPWLARSRLGVAELLIARDGAGDRELANRTAILAAVTARELGMGVLLHRAEQIGERLAGPGSLTPREREIAALVATGASNRAIAARLVLSDRTVETHVQHILGKLGFHARTQIATWATREGVQLDGDR